MPLPPVPATVAHLIADAAVRAPQAEAIVFGDRRLRYAEYAACIGAFAAELQSLGAAGERVATVLPNSLEACVAQLAAQVAGAQLAPLNPLYTERELAEILDDAAPRIAVVDEALAARVGPLARAAGAREVIVVGVASRRLDTARAAAWPDPPDPGAFALLQYTGGTTGRAKGVNLTHRAIMTNVAQREALLPTRGTGERILCVMPLFHSYAMAMGLYLAAYTRGCLVVLPRYQPQEVLAAVARERITIFPGSPTIFVGLMAHPDFARTDWRTVHTCYSGAAPLSEQTLRRWREAVGAPVYEGYGQTEAGPVLSFNPVAGPVKPASVGVAAPETELQIVDAETGTRVLGVGERGEIRARGPQLMSSYRNRPQESAVALRGGWLYTGDIGELDADGYLYIRDRKKDMAIVGGYNVYPREVDEVLFLHPDVADAAAVGAPDAYRGEVIRAFVVLRAGARTTAEDLVAHCRANLAPYKVPASIECLTALPKTTVNKTDKQALRVRAAAG
ncbi:MAG TPA: AMP-binding protein [Burkholderiales bacterium]|nr:AMP-binding protein [Burkholderiales bacterium]